MQSVSPIISRLPWFPEYEETHGGALIGGDPETIRERAEKASVTNFVNEKMVPMMILHGDNDPIVPDEVSSDILYRKIVEAGLEDRVSYYMDSLWLFWKFYPWFNSYVGDKKEKN